MSQEHWAQGLNTPWMGHQLITGVHTDSYTLIHAQGQFTYWHVFRGGRKPENPGETKMNTEI